jgi:hypothetical protein
MTLVADLRLRFGGARLPARAYLPLPSAADSDGAPLVLWLAGRKTGDVLCRELSATASAVVVEIGTCAGSQLEVAALGWAVEHARELGAHPGRLVVAGQLAGAGRAARLAVDLRDTRWPPVRRQLLVRPEFSSPHPAPDRVAGTAPATIITTSLRRDDGSGYASTLRDAGVDVQEVVSDPWRAPPLGELARALR